jgi:hypothetical protein
VTEQCDKSFDEAMNNELHRVLAVAAASDALNGAKSFIQGAGKHGKF